MSIIHDVRWLRAAGWFTRENSSGWFLTRRGSTLQTNFDEACKIQKRRDAAMKGRTPKDIMGPTLSCYIDSSTLRPGGISIRLNAGDRTSTKFVEALKAAGFKPGDHVELRMRANPTERTPDGERRGR